MLIIMIPARLILFDPSLPIQPGGEVSERDSYISAGYVKWLEVRDGQGMIPVHIASHFMQPVPH